MISVGQSLRIPTLEDALKMAGITTDSGDITSDKNVNFDDVDQRLVRHKTAPGSTAGNVYASRGHGGVHDCNYVMNPSFEDGADAYGMKRVQEDNNKVWTCPHLTPMRAFVCIYMRACICVWVWVCFSGTRAWLYVHELSILACIVTAQAKID
jgi:hypothetical protein